MIRPTRLSFFLTLLITATFAYLHVLSDGGSFEGAQPKALFISMLVSSLASLAVMSLPILSEALRRRDTLHRLFSADVFRTVPRGRALLSIILAFVVIFSAAMMLLSILPADAEQDLAQALRLLSLPQKAVLSICICVLTPLVEEILFRGILMHSFPQRIAIPASAFCFALAHGLSGIDFPLFLIGILLALEVRRTGTLWSAVALHGAFNLLNLLLVESL